MSSVNMEENKAADGRYLATEGLIMGAMFDVSKGWMTYTGGGNPNGTYWFNPRCHISVKAVHQYEFVLLSGR